MKTILLLVLLGSASIAVATETPDQRAQREVRNVKVMMEHYPKASLRAGEQGSVLFNLSLDRDGAPTGCEVTRSSGYKRLDDATCDLVLRYAIFQPNHNDTGGKMAMTSEGALNWAIPDRAQIEAASHPLVKTNALDQQICKRQLRVGSLAIYERTCRTLREWQTETEDMKKPWRDIQAGWGHTHG